MTSAEKFPRDVPDATSGAPLERSVEKHPGSPVEQADAPPLVATRLGDFREIWITDLLPGKGHRGDDDVADLVESLGRTPQLQPIVVRPVSGGFEIIAGHRRAEAYRRMGVSQVWAQVIDVDDRDAEICSLEENLRRRRLSDENAAKARLVVLLREERPSARGGDRRSEAYISKRQVGQKVESAVAKVAKETKSSERTVRRALKVEERGIAAVKEALSGKTINVLEAEAIAKLPADAQAAALASVINRKARDRGAPLMKKLRESFDYIAGQLQKKRSNGLTPEDLRGLRLHAAAVVEAIDQLLAGPTT